MTLYSIVHCGPHCTQVDSSSIDKNCQCLFRCLAPSISAAVKDMVTNVWGYVAHTRTSIARVGSGSQTVKAIFANLSGIELESPRPSPPVLRPTLKRPVGRLVENFDAILEVVLVVFKAGPKYSAIRPISATVRSQSGCYSCPRICTKSLR